MTADDLKNYRPHVRQPVRGRYRGHEIISMPPSSSGGVVLIEMLNVLEGYKLNEQDDAARLHLMIEAMRRAYADRAAYLGDPAVVTRAAGAADVQALRRAASRQHRSRSAPRPSREIRGDLSAAARRREHHAFLGDRPLRQRGRQHLHAQFQLRRRPGGRRHRRAAQQRARRFRRAARHAQRLRADRRRRQRARARTSGRCRR